MVANLGRCFEPRKDKREGLERRTGTGPPFLPTPPARKLRGATVCHQVPLERRDSDVTIS